MTVTLKIPIPKCRSCHIPDSNDTPRCGKQPMAVMRRQMEMAEEDQRTQRKEEAREEDQNAANYDDELMFPLDDCGEVAFTNMEGDSIDRLIMESMSSSFIGDHKVSDCVLESVENEPSDAATVLDDDEAPRTSAAVSIPTSPSPADALPPSPSPADAAEARSPIPSPVTAADSLISPSMVNNIAPSSILPHAAVESDIAPPSIPPATLVLPSVWTPTGELTQLTMITKDSRFVRESSPRILHNIGRVHRLIIHCGQGNLFHVFMRPQKIQAFQEAFIEARNNLDASLHIVDSEDDQKTAVVEEDVLYDVYDKHLVATQIGIRGCELVYRISPEEQSNTVPMALPIATNVEEPLSSMLRRPRPGTPTSSDGIDPKWVVSRMMRRGYKIVKAKGDGNCLYRSVSRMLYGTEDHHAKVRALVNYSIRLDPEYEHFKSFETTENIENGIRSGEMAGDMEIACIAKLFGYCFHVLGQDFRPIITHGDIVDPALYLIFSSAHYDAFTDGVFIESSVFKKHHRDSPDDFYAERMPRGQLQSVSSAIPVVDPPAAVEAIPAAVEAIPAASIVTRAVVQPSRRNKRRRCSTTEAFKPAPVESATIKVNSCFFSHGGQRRSRRRCTTFYYGRIAGTPICTTLEVLKQTTSNFILESDEDDQEHLFVPVKFEDKDEYYVEWSIVDAVDSREKKRPKRS